MKAISKTFPYPPTMNIESKLCTTVARRIDLFAGVAEPGEFAGKPRTLNTGSMHKVDAISGSN